MSRSLGASPRGSPAPAAPVLPSPAPSSRGMTGTPSAAEVSRPRAIRSVRGQSAFASKSPVLAQGLGPLRRVPRQPREPGPGGGGALSPRLGTSRGDGSTGAVAGTDPGPGGVPCPLTPKAQLRGSLESDGPTTGRRLCPGEDGVAARPVLPGLPPSVLVGERAPPLQQPVLEGPGEKAPHKTSDLRLRAGGALSQRPLDAHGPGAHADWTASRPCRCAGPARWTLHGGPCSRPGCDPHLAGEGCPSAEPERVACPRARLCHCWVSGSRAAGSRAVGSAHVHTSLSLPLPSLGSLVDPWGTQQRVLLPSGPTAHGEVPAT